MPDSDFPDLRVMAYVKSVSGETLFTIPRERDLLRIYVALADKEIIDPATGRADKDRTSPEKILDHARKVFAPYKMNIKDGGIDWWTAYVSECS